MADPEGAARCQANVDQSREAYQKALAMEPQNATAHRGLGFLFERENDPAEASAQFEKYLQLAPNAKDARQIRMRLETLKSHSAAKPQAKRAEEPARVREGAE